MRPASGTTAAGTACCARDGSCACRPRASAPTARSAPPTAPRCCTCSAPGSIWRRSPARSPQIAARAPGLRPPLVADPFESLVTSVTAQQVSLLSACAMRSRFVRRLGVRHELDGVCVCCVPAPAGRGRPRPRGSRPLAREDPRDPGARRGRSRPRRHGRRRRSAAHLVALPGIGGWTVDWFMARCLGGPTRSRPAIWACARPWRGGSRRIRSGPRRGCARSAPGSGSTPTWPCTTCSRPAEPRA